MALLDGLDIFKRNKRTTDPEGGYFGTGKKSLEDEMRSKAESIEAEETSRYRQGLGGLTTAYNNTQSALSQLIDPSLMFSRAGDQIGARAKANLNAVRTSLGARGLNPNSGAASSLLNRISFETNNAAIGAERDVAIENQRQRQINAALGFQAALGLANYTQSPVSGVGLDVLTNLYEGQIAREGIAAQKKSSDKASSNNLLGGLIGAGASIIGGLL